MNIVTPKFADVKAGVTSFFSGLGLIPSILIVIAVGAILFYLFGAATGYISNAWTDHKVNAALAEAQHWKEVADQKQAEADQNIGAAAAYKQQSAQIAQELLALQQARPDLQKQTKAASEKVATIRSAPLVAVTNDMRARVDEIGKKLDTLYP